jgi:hypothetical protein
MQYLEQQSAGVHIPTFVLRETGAQCESVTACHRHSNGRMPANDEHSAKLRI